MEDTQEKAEQIFFDVLELPTEDRESFIADRCGDDATLRSLVDSLLAADRAAGEGNFLESRFLGGMTPEPQTSEPGQAATDALGDEERFQILSRYEQGGLGEVLLARDRQLNRDVAVKQIRPKWLDHNEARERFVQEAEITGILEHPGIVPVYAMGKWKDGRPFYAMRFIQGVTLREEITRLRQLGESSDEDQRSLQFRSLLNRFVDVCNTIEYAHSRRIIHRDIKPSNIMVGPYGETLVVDWGLAKRLDAPVQESITALLMPSSSGSSGSRSSHTQVGGAVGTPQYMSPEQAAGKIDEVGVKTDVYLLGATLYQILTGVPPHDETSVSKLIQRITEGILERPSRLDASIPAPLEAICLKAMATSKYDRYVSASELGADVERWMADEPVSAYRDPVSVQWARWGRQHRTLAMSGFVAAILLTIGSIVGAASWSYQRSKQFEVEGERNLKEAQLLASRQQRLGELRDSAAAALDLSLREIRANRFGASLSLLQNSIDVLEQEPSFAEQRDQMLARADRVKRIIKFRHQSKLSEQYNVSSRDTQGIIASATSLQALGIWDQEDWWAHLPDQDLAPEQKDELRWDVYQQWLMLDGMLVKTIGTRLFGTSPSPGMSQLLPVLRRMRSGEGKSEAEAVMVVSDRIDWFRRSEAARWYRGIGQFRLGKGRRLSGDELGAARNAPDAQKLGVLCLLSAMDPNFRVVFNDYKKQDPIVAGLDLFLDSASQRPSHYWTQLTLGQMQYFIVDQETNPTWKSYQPAIQTMGRCIAINPQSCFAFADRSSLFRFQFEQLQSIEPLDGETDTEHQDQAAELLKWSLQDAQTAYRLGTDQPWVGWTYGMALSVTDQTDQAVAVFLKASRLTYPLMEIGDSTLIRADDIRGRSAAAEYAKQLIDQHPDNPRYRTLLASIRFNQEQYDEVSDQVERALEHPHPPSHAYAIRGMLRLRRADIKGASEDFQVALESDPTHIWAAYGMAACHDAGDQYTEALDAYRHAAQLSQTDEHHAACLLGVGRSAAMLGQYSDATEAVTLAQALQPACDIVSVAKPLVQRLRHWIGQSKDPEKLQPLKSFLKHLRQLSVDTEIKFAKSSQSRLFSAPLLNGDFELDGIQYWSDGPGMAWRNEPGYAGRAEISKSESHEGESSLHIVGATSSGQEKRGSTSQIIPIPENSRGRVTVWAKAIDLEPGAVKVHIGQWATLELEGSSYDWKPFHVEFSVGEASDPSWTTVPVSLSIISAGPGEIYLDDLEITLAK